MAGSHAVSLLPLRSLQRRGSGARAAFSFYSAFRLCEGLGGQRRRAHRYSRLVRLPSDAGIVPESWLDFNALRRNATTSSEQHYALRGVNADARKSRRTGCGAEGQG